MSRQKGERGILFLKGRWWVRVYVDGREQRLACDTKSQAKAVYGRLKAEIREGIYFPEKYRPKEEITLRTWLARVVERSTNRGKGNEQRYARRWMLYLGKRLLSRVTTEDVRHVQAAMHAKGTWSDATINRHLAFLRHALALAVRDGKLARNPVSGVHFFPEVNRTRFLTEREIANLRAHLTADDWLLVAVAIETGLRREEQFRLRWEHVDLENSVVTIPLPKGGKTRHVPLSAEAGRLLRSLESFTVSPWVWPGLRDMTQPMDSRAFMRRAWGPALQRAGIVGACWHTLRHTAASRRIMAGVDLVTVKAFLGHREIETTLRYAHLAPSHLREAVNKGSLRGATGQNRDLNRDHNRDQKNDEKASASQPAVIVARPTGLEPVTPRSVVWCSIH